MKGIVLAGGAGSRLYPLSKATSKQLMPVFDKPMIYYPISTLMLAGIREILIICSPEHLHAFKQLLGTGERWGVEFQFLTQAEPNGIAEAFLIGEEFIAGDSVFLILGDNLFYGVGLGESLQEKINQHTGAKIYCQKVQDPERYGVVEIDNAGKVISIEEKPSKPKSNLASTGIYLFDKDVVKHAKTLVPSERGELEITDLHQIYLSHGKLAAEVLERGVVWLDTGTIESLAAASEFIRVVQERQGFRIACPEEIAWRMKYISDEQLLKLATSANNPYNRYLAELIKVN
jgi:glucose-1-phosphate thymidylyltransferase